MNESRKYVVVLGSKPDARMPAVDAVEVYAANLSLLRALYYREQFGSRLTSTLGGIQIRKEEIRNAIFHVVPDRIVVRHERETPEKFLRHRLPDLPIQNLSTNEQFQIQVDTVGRRMIWGAVKMKPLKKKFKHLKRYYFQNFATSGCTTGVWSGLYALLDRPDVDVIFSGVGLIGGAHFRGENQMSLPGGIRDRWTVQRIQEPFRSRLWTTDPYMHEQGGIPLWEGGTVDADIAVPTE